MLFYKIDVDLQGDTENVDKSERCERAEAMQPATEQCFEQCAHSRHIAVANIIYPKRKALLCAAVKNGTLSAQAVEEFLQAVELPYGKFEMTEVTQTFYCAMLRTSERNQYINDDYEVKERISISALERGHMSFDETLVTDGGTQSELLSRSSTLLCDAGLSEEIHRIFQTKQTRDIAAHPVHYIIQTDDNDTKDEILRILLTALWKNGRLKSRRYCEVGYGNDHRMPGDGLKMLYESCAGAAMVVNFMRDNDEDEDEHANIETHKIISLCDIMRKFRNDVLTVFCLPKSCERARNVFYENLGAVTVVPLREETVFGGQAKEYLRALAKKHGIKPDRGLYKTVEDDGKGHSPSDLNLAFDEWRDRVIKTRVFPQYAGLATANRQIATSKPKGSAYDELENMIGLCEAKKVIHQALDFYKAQKLFHERGFTNERPAMHMVFTGNPGTAKTTVARLFAQIMKDNGLLSVGDLHEVGRADLVGRFVGWTAPTVKKRFREAKGSVLFIDEAYSLVDDRDGLYGDEAINTIVQEMENYREDMVVIFAGYTDKMESFLNKNPGLRSRIAFHVPFADYNAEDLVQITELLAGKKKLKLGDGVSAKLLLIFEAAMKTDDFGNGRFARNMFEKAVMKQASRLVAMDVDDVCKRDVATLLAEDFEAPAASKPTVRRIGFV